MAVTSPEQMTAAFEAAYNARDKAALMRLYALDAVHSFDGVAVSCGIAAISAAFDRGFAGSTKLRGRTLGCMVTGQTALLRVLWQSLDPAGAVLRENISCEVVTKGADGLWRYIIDDATGGSRKP
jgi:ketosteroid isomerase-like protein